MDEVIEHKACITIAFTVHLQHHVAANGRSQGPIRSSGPFSRTMGPQERVASGWSRTDNRSKFHLGSCLTEDRHGVSASATLLRTGGMVSAW